MKLLNKATTIIILLVGVILVFSFIEPYVGNLEGFDNDSDKIKTDSVPSCGKSDVPACYSTLMPDDYSHFNADFLKTDDYILKTQIVTPVTPNCPISLGSDITKPEERIETPDEHLFPEHHDKPEAKRDEKPQEKHDAKIDEKNPTWPLPNSNATNAAATDASSYMLNTPTVPSSKPPEPANTCPPCPACERCPEPSVECKRVVNYSNSNGRLPVPVINDFSKF